MPGPQVKAKVVKEEASMESKSRKFKENNVPWDPNALKDLQKATLMLVRHCCPQALPRPPLPVPFLLFCHGRRRH